MDCLFCKIISGEIPSKKAYEDDKSYVFYDIAPVAPLHLLVIPKKHIDSLETVQPEDTNLLGHLQLVISKVAHDLKLENGYRVVSNCGTDGMQSVLHLHYHLLGGQAMGWPPFA